MPSQSDERLCRLYRLLSTWPVEGGGIRAAAESVEFCVCLAHLVWIPWFVSLASAAERSPMESEGGADPEAGALGRSRFGALRRLGSALSPHSARDEAIRLYFWQGVPNLGDQVAEVLVRELSGREVRVVGKRDRRKLIACGSTIHRARRGDHVWGAGDAASRSVSRFAADHCSRGARADHS